MRDPFIAIDAATNLRSQARTLRQCWERARGGGTAGDGVRPLIEASWRRTERAGVDPEYPDPRQAFAPDALDDHRDASGLRDCLDSLRACLSPLASESAHVMVVTDADCRILWMEGDPKVRRRAEGIVFQEGMDWTERSVGTNAIGTALAIDHAVQVFSAEHFSAKQHPWWCSAAPIHDPATGALLGVVDISGPMHTAHPHSLALVSAAARLAEQQLRAGLAAREERLRRAYLEHTVGSGRAAAGLLAADGRVLLAEGGWRAAALEVPPGGGPLLLPGGRAALAEPLAHGAGYVLWDAGPAGPLPLRLELLGRDGPRVRLGDAAPLPLRPRHAEALFILALHPEGLTSEDLTRALYGDVGKEVSTRAELSRLRKLLPGAVGARPYRLTGAVSVDVLDVERALRRGDREGALRAYHAPLLPDSAAPRVRRARRELEGALRRAAVTGGTAGLWAWLETRSGREDADALAAYVRHAGPRDPRRALAAARLRALQEA